eukprot:ANDGO_06496.mRNA.1 hypothetical protein
MVSSSSASSALPPQSPDTRRTSWIVRPRTLVPAIVNEGHSTRIAGRDGLPHASRGRSSSDSDQLGSHVPSRLTRQDSINVYRNKRASQSTVGNSSNNSSNSDALRMSLQSLDSGPRDMREALLFGPRPVPVRNMKLRTSLSPNCRIERTRSMNEKPPSLRSSSLSSTGLNKSADKGSGSVLSSEDSNNTVSSNPSGSSIGSSGYETPDLISEDQFLVLSTDIAANVESALASPISGVEYSNQASCSGTPSHQSEAALDEQLLSHALSELEQRVVEMGDEVVSPQKIATFARLPADNLAGKPHPLVRRLDFSSAQRLMGIQHVSTVNPGTASSTNSSSAPCAKSPSTSSSSQTGTTSSISGQTSTHRILRASQDSANMSAVLGNSPLRRQAVRSLTDFADGAIRGVIWAPTTFKDSSELKEGVQEWISLVGSRRLAHQDEVDDVYELPSETQLCPPNWSMDSENDDGDSEDEDEHDEDASGCGNAERVDYSMSNMYSHHSHASFSASMASSGFKFI